MSLPNVKIELQGEALGGLTPLNDGIAGLIGPGKEIKVNVDVEADDSAETGAKKKEKQEVKKTAYNKSYEVHGLKDVEEKCGITEENNPIIYKHCKAFYDKAGQNATLWLMVCDSTVKREDIVDKSKDYAAQLLRAAEGKIRLLGIIGNSGENLSKALENANTLAEEFQKEYQPVSILLEGGYPPSVDLHQSKYKYVSVVLGNDKGNTAGFAGLVLGRLASIPVQRNIGRVKDGPLTTEAYLGESNVAMLNNGTLSGWHDKGYIIPRRHPSLDGYYLNDDPTCIATDNDFSSIARVRVIEKARLLAHSVLLQELNEEVPIDSASGRIDPAYAKALQSKVENKINLQMVLEGEAQGVDCLIDSTQNILATAKLKLSLKILPVAYSKYIEVELSFNNPFKSK